MPGGFECSVSEDEGKTWTEFQRFFSYKDEYSVVRTYIASKRIHLNDTDVLVERYIEKDNGC